MERIAQPTLVIVGDEDRAARGDSTPVELAHVLAERLPRAVQLLVRQVNVVDLLAAGWISLSAGATGLLLLGWDQVTRVFRRSSGRAGAKQPAMARA